MPSVNSGGRVELQSLVGPGADSIHLINEMHSQPNHRSNGFSRATPKKRTLSAPPTRYIKPLLSLNYPLSFICPPLWNLITLCDIKTTQPSSISSTRSDLLYLSYIKCFRSCWNLHFPVVVASLPARGSGDGVRNALSRSVGRIIVDSEIGVLVRARGVLSTNVGSEL